LAPDLIGVAGYFLSAAFTFNAEALLRELWAGNEQGDSLGTNRMYHEKERLGLDLVALFLRSYALDNMGQKVVIKTSVFFWLFDFNGSRQSAG